MYYGPERKNQRLKNYDYSSAGYYFVTFCTKNRIDYFGEIIEGKMILNDYGKIIQEGIIKTQDIRDEIEETGKIRKMEIDLDEYVIMPNHVHIIIIKKESTIENERGRERLQSFPTDETGIFDNTGALGLHGNNISGVLRGIKSSTTRNIRQNYGDYEFAWQKSFHDVIIRNQEQLEKSREYIILNLSKLEEDVNNPINIFQK